MQKTKFLCRAYVMIFGVVLLANCTSKNSGQIITPTTVPETPKIQTTESTLTATRIAETITPVPTPIPTLESEIAQQRVTELFETNNDCRLPCWWGITPGKTKWADALKILAPISSTIDPYFPNSPAASVYVNIISPNEMLYGGVLGQDYYIENGIVTEITLGYNFDLAKFTYFKPFIRENGIPDQIFIHGYGEPQLDTWPFEIALFYPEKGMLLEYSGSPVIRDDNLVVCWGEEHFPVSIHLWRPEPNVTFEEVIARYYVPDSTDLPPYTSVDEVTVNSDHFFDELNNFEEKLCFETPQKFWLGQR